MIRVVLRTIGMCLFGACATVGHSYTLAAHKGEANLYRAGLVPAGSPRKVSGYVMPSPLPRLCPSHSTNAW